MTLLTPETVSEYGMAAIACFFILMYVSTVWFVVKEMRKQRDNEIKKAEYMAQVVIQNTEANKMVSKALTDNIAVCKELVMLIKEDQKRKTENHKLEEIRNMIRKEMQGEES